MGGTIPPGNCLQPANNNCFRPRAGRAVVYLVEQRDGSLVQQLTTRAAAPNQALQQQSRLVSKLRAVSCRRRPNESPLSLFALHVQSVECYHIIVV